MTRRWNYSRAALGLPLAASLGCAALPGRPPAELPPAPAVRATSAVPAPSPAPAAPSGVIQAQLTEAAPAPAAPPADGPLTLDRLEQLAQANNPILVRDAARVESSRGQALQAGLYPNPRFDTNNPEVFAGRNSLFNVGVQQEIVTAGKLRLDTAAAAEAVKQAQLTYEENRLRLVADVRRQYYTVLAAQQRVRVLTSLAALVKAAAETGQKREKAGVSSQIDTLLLTLDSQQVEANLRRSEANLRTERKQLAATAGVPGVESADLVGDLTSDRRPDFDEELVRRYAIDASTLVRVAQAEITRRHILLRRARAEPYPNLNVGPAYQFGAQPGNDQFWFTVTFPIPAWNLNQGNIRSASADIRDAEMRLKVVQNEQLQRVADAVGRYQAARQTAEQYEREILPNVTRAQKLAQEGYAKGEFESARYLAAQRTVVESNLSYLEALETLWTAAADVAGLMQLERLPEGPTVRQP